jgi:uncharacterized membrane protein SirB2
MSYLLLKYTHIVCAAASFALFFIRGIWAIRAYPSVQEPWAKALPHVIDGLLVLSAISMLYVSFPTAWGGAWMPVKLVLIVVYVGMVAFVLRFAKSRAVRGILWFAALILYLYITSIAVLHNPAGIFLIL